jgi:division protein CdvB (Snf7/Vps24/ESCRT-III family)
MNILDEIIEKLGTGLAQAEAAFKKFAAERAEMEAQIERLHVKLEASRLIVDEHNRCWQETQRLNNHINKLDAQIARLHEENQELRKRAAMVEYVPGDW